MVALLANRLVDAAEPYYGSAFHGLGALPPRSAWAVATAHGVYRDIGLQVRALGAAAWNGRIATGRSRKLGHVVRGAAKAALARARADAAAPGGTVDAAARLRRALNRRPPSQGVVGRVSSRGSRAAVAGFRRCRSAATVPARRSASRRRSTGGA